MSLHTASGGIGDQLPKGLAAFRRLLHFVGRVELGLAIAALVVVVGLSTAQAFLRNTVGASLWWAQEIAENTIMFTYFLGVSYVFKTRQYIVIEFVSSLSPLRLQMVFYLIAQVLAFIFAVAVLWLVYLFSPTLLNMTTPVLKLPAIVNSGPLILASAMIALTSIYYLAFGLWAMASNRMGHSLYEMEAQGIVLQPWEEEE